MDLLRALDNAVREIKETLPALPLLENEPMAAHSSFRIGGPVRAFALPGDITSFSRLTHILKKNRLLPLVTGNRTNILFPDEGLPELFIISTERMDRLFLLPDGAIYAEAGVSLAKLSSFACQHSLSGLEFASGIPGSVGGGILMNAGAYGGEMKDVTESVVTYYLPQQKLYETLNAQCGFGYRRSAFQTIAGCAIVSAVFRLKEGDPEEISAKMRELNDRRREKQPLDLPSAGSAFRRPEGYYAAALIDECGLKGYTVGGAQVSPKHAGFVVNLGNATSHDVYDLMMHVRSTVYQQKGVPLEPEIILLSPEYRLVDESPAAPLHHVYGSAFQPSPESEE
jgi:UDP-N-acetylmuramate dehydrogenase